MTDQAKKSQFQNLAAGFLGFVGVVGFGSLVILHHGASKPRAYVYAPPSAAVVSTLAAPAQAVKVNLSGAPLALSANALSSPAPTLPDEAREEAAAAPAAADAATASAARAPGAAAAAKLVASGPLDASSSASSSASASASASAQPKAKALAKKTFLEPKLDLSKSQGTLASSVHYGVSDRAELMGRAAGPVYNFSGKSVGQAQSGQVAADNAGPAALDQVDAAKKQIDASDVPADQKATIDRKLDQVRAVTPSAGQ